MARLILINGTPGSGKSTLARRYVAEHPLALALDVDLVRGMLGGWLDEPIEAGLLARRLALAMARVQLREGRDVVVPQFLGRLDFVLQLEALCRDVAADFVEVALFSDLPDAEERFARRSRDSAIGAHRDAAALQDRLGGLPAFAAMHDRLIDVIANRPGTLVIDTVDGAEAQAYRALCAAVDPR